MSEYEAENNLQEQFPRHSLAGRSYQQSSAPTAPNRPDPQFGVAPAYQHRYSPTQGRIVPGVYTYISR